jgi:hypothetical protein
MTAMQRAPLVKSWVLDGTNHQEAHEMLYAGLDLSRQKLDVHILGRSSCYRPFESSAPAVGFRCLRSQSRHISFQ